MDDDIKDIVLGMTQDRKLVVAQFLREDGHKLTLELSPDTVSKVIAKLQSLYAKMIH